MYVYIYIYVGCKNIRSFLGTQNRRGRSGPKRDHCFDNLPFDICTCTCIRTSCVSACVWADGLEFRVRVTLTICTNVLNPELHFIHQLAPTDHSGCKALNPRLYYKPHNIHQFVLTRPCCSAVLGVWGYFEVENYNLQCGGWRKSCIAEDFAKFSTIGV